LRNIELVPLICLDTASQMAVRDMRNEKNIRKWMYRDHLIELNEHLAWINKVKSDKSQIFFIIMEAGNSPLGAVGISAIDYLHKKADWAFYLTEKARGGLGSAIEYCIINFIFDRLHMEKLNCEVIGGNDAVIKLHKKFLFKEEGFKRSNIIKGGKRRAVHFLGLTHKDWVEGRENIYKKYKKIFDKFSISNQWDEAVQDSVKHPLDEIEAARSRNNLNWMNVLRLVLELSPEHGKALVTDIRDIDKEISKLTDKLISSFDQ